MTMTQPKGHPPAGVVIRGAKTTSSLKSWLLAAGFLAIAFLVYQPAWHAGFIWDDDDHLTANPAMTVPNGLGMIWSSMPVSRYYPLTLTSFCDGTGPANSLIVFLPARPPLQLLIRIRRGWRVGPARPRETWQAYQRTVAVRKGAPTERGGYSTETLDRYFSSPMSLPVESKITATFLPSFVPSIS